MAEELRALIADDSPDLLDRAFSALSGRLSRSDLQEVALSGLVWRNRLANSRQGGPLPNIAVLQFPDGAERRERLARDLESIGLSKAAASIGPVATQAVEDFKKTPGDDARAFMRSVSAVMEAGDRYLKLAKPLLEEHNPHGEDVDGAIRSYLKSHIDAFDGVDAPEKKKSLLGRLFG